MSKTYLLQYMEEVQKDLKRLDKPSAAKALQALERLKTDPHSGHTLHGSLKGYRALEFSAPGGAFRAIYRIDGGVCCLVILVGPHENIYEIAERRVKRLKSQ